MPFPSAPDTTPELASLLEPKNLSARRALAENQFKDLTSDSIKVLRRKAKQDPFFLATAFLEHHDLTVSLHGGLTAWMRKTEPDTQYRIVLLPRDHYKSTVVTETDSVRLALPDDAGDCPYPASLGPNIKILLAHETKDFAASLLLPIQKAFLEKPMMLALFPECIPTPRTQIVNQYQLELPRTQHHREPTFDTIGTGGRAQGRHYHYLKLDDLIGEEARDSETVMRKAKNWFDNINSLLTKPKIDKWDLVGTHWGPGDLYEHAMARYGVNKARSVLIRPERYLDFPEGVVAYIRGIIENGQPIFPELMGHKEIDVLRKNPRVFSAQYANDPISGEMTDFKSPWLKYYNLAGAKLENIVIFTGESSEKINIWETDRLILVDPSLGEKSDSDHTGIVVTGTDKKERVFILETVKERLSPPDLIERLFKLHAKWTPRFISIEKVAFSATYKYWMDAEARKRKVNPLIMPFPPPNASATFYRTQKRARIQALTNYFSAGQIFIQEGMTEFKEEYDYFPVGGARIGEHLLDALAQGPHLWTGANPQREVKKVVEAERELLACRDAYTGY